jgi:hypothetical protein
VTHWHRIIPTITYCVTFWTLKQKCRVFVQFTFIPTKRSHRTGFVIEMNMMTTIRKDCQLSKIFTNHSLRATTVHLLDIAWFPDRHIMSVTGHKAESSLKTYTGSAFWLYWLLELDSQIDILEYLTFLQCHQSLYPFSYWISTDLPANQIMVTSQREGYQWLTITAL